MKDSIVIVGMGKSGKAAMRLLLLLGYSQSQIKTFDKNPGVADFNKPEEVLKLRPKTLLVSPGIDLKTPWIKQLIADGATLTSEIDLAAQQLRSEKVIGITGSMGKSTTTSLLSAGAHSFSSLSFAGGNLGFPLADYIADVLENKRNRADWIILELSSYQLENCPSLKTELSILTALSPNHLERYSNLEEYYSTKWALKNNTRTQFLLNFDNLEVVRWCSPRLDNKCTLVKATDMNLISFKLKESKLVGNHNQQNLALATQAALLLNWPESSIQAMKNYSGLAHRIENVGRFRGIQFINDSKATTIESVLAAIDSCLPLVKGEGLLHILIGGRDKNLPWEELSQIRMNAKVFSYFFGECGSIAQKKSNLPGSYHLRLEQALSEVIHAIEPGDVVLLSPGGSSLDEFQSFEDRGDFFKKFISTLGSR